MEAGQNNLLHNTEQHSSVLPLMILISLLGNEIANHCENVTTYRYRINVCNLNIKPRSVKLAPCVTDSKTEN
jgi:hypothetical protein